jgi:hypothetical protein
MIRRPVYFYGSIGHTAVQAMATLGRFNKGFRMSIHLTSRRLGIHVVPALIAVLPLVLVLLARQPGCAADLAEQAHSLRMAPADAAFYSASLRLKEQFDVLVESKAYAKLLEIPLVQLVKMQVAFQWQQSPEPTVAKFREYVQSAEGQEAVAVLKEMFSEEMFVYGGGDIAQSFKLLMKLNGIQRTARLEAAARGEEVEKVVAERIRKVLEEDAEQFKVPTLVFGFRIKDADRARRQLDEVHALVRNQLDAQRPELSAHLQRDQIGGHEFLTLRLDGSMIPWDEIREKATDIDSEQLEQWRAMLSSKTLTVALGVVDEFVLLSLGDSTDHLATIGGGKFLVDQPAIGRLARHAEERIASIGYVSQSLARSMNSPQQTVEDLAATAEQVLRQADIAEDHRSQLVEDIRSLDIAKYMPEQGEASSVVFLTARGYEGFKYGTGARPMMDSSKPLTILNQAGGSPMLVFASRSRDTVEDYDSAIEWLTRTAKHVEQIAETKAKPEDWAKYQQYRERIVGLLHRLNEANREYLYPAFADNQGALVVDVASTSKQWIRHMPASPKPLPILGIAMVASVSDAERLRQGAKEYFAVVRDAIALARELNPEKVPDFDLRKPQKRELEDGSALYVYPLPEEWGVDAQVAPNGGLSDSAAAISMRPETTERLLRPTPLKVDTPLDLNRPAAMVAHFEFHKLIGAIKPWIDYGLDVAMGNLKTDGDDESDAASPPEQSPMMLQMGFVVPQIHQFLDVASALRSASSVTYQEDGLWVTHSETHFEDLK